MKSIKNLEQSIAQQQEVLAEMKQLVSDRDLYKRILIQAILSNQGMIKVDPAMAEEAMKRMKNAQLEFGNGKVCFLQEKFSIFME